MQCPHCKGTGKIDVPVDELRLGFGKFWEVYPVKRNQVAAKRGWLNLLPSTKLIETIVASISLQQEEDHFGDYWPYPATYLRDKRWEEIPMTEQNIKKWLES